MKDVPLSPPISLILEFTRAEAAADPYAFHFTAQQYLLRGDNGGIESATLPWGDGLLADLEAVRQPGRSPVIVQRLGETLRQFLDEADWEAMESQLLTASRQNREVVLTIRSAAAELYALPWELTTLRNTGQHIAELPEVLIRYEWPETASAPLAPEAMQESGRILFAWSAAAGAVPAAEQLAAIESACQHGNYPFSRETDVLPHASCARLVEVLSAAAKQGAPFAVLHLLCHGSSEGQIFGLALDGGDDDGDSKVLVDAGQLRQLLTPFAGTLRMVVLSACDSGNMGALGNQLGSVAQTLHRAGIALVVASRFPMSVVGSIRLTEVLYGELVGGPHSLEQTLRRVRQKLAQSSHHMDWASLQFYGHCADGLDNRPLVIRPYRGLLYFQPEHQRFFFGRQDSAQAVLRNLAQLSAGGRPRFVIVAGASGTGKSSMVMAGVVPRFLEQKPTAKVARIRPGSDPETPLTKALAELLGAATGAPAEPLLLVVDQLEELFINIPDLKRREAFIQRLWALASDPASRLCVVVTLRVDFVGRCGEIVIDEAGHRLDSVAYNEAHRVFLSQMGPEELRAAIEKPAQVVGLELEEGLVLRMIQDVRGEPGALPVLQATLDILWQNRRGRMLAQAAYYEMGGVAGALQGRAKAVIDSLDERERQVARRLLLRLVHIGNDPAQSTRRVVSLARLMPNNPLELAFFNCVLERFVEARLMVLSQHDPSQPRISKVPLDMSQSSLLLRAPRSQIDLLRSIAPMQDYGGVLIEVAHEALIRKWDLLQQWILQDRRMLAELSKIEECVRQWKEHKTLLTGSALGYAIEVGKRYPQDLPAGTRTMIKMSQARANRRLRLRQLTVGLVVLTALILAVLGWFGIRSDRQARSFAAKARDALRVAEVERLPQLWSRNMQFLRELEGKEPPPGWLDSAVNALAQAGTVVIHLGPPPESRFPAAVAMSPDGRLILSAAAENRAVVHSATNILPPVTLPDHGALVTAGAFSADGALLATAAQDALIRLWPAAGSAEPSILLKGHTQDIQALAFSPKGGALASAALDGTARLWNVSGGDATFTLAHRGAVHALAYSPDGQRLVTGSADGLARIWQVETGDLYATLSGHTKAIRAVVFSRDGARLLTTSEDGTARLWAPTGGPSLATLQHWKPVIAAAFSPNGKWLATSTADRIWLRTSAGAPVAVLRSPCGDRHLGIAFSPDNSQLLLALSDHSLHIVPLEFQLPALLRRFWQEQSCPDVEQLQRVLLQSESVAAAQLANCQQMQRCLQEQLEEEPDRFDACYTQFHSRQEALNTRMVLGGRD